MVPERRKRVGPIEFFFIVGNINEAKNELCEKKSKWEGRQPTLRYELRCKCVVDCNKRM